MWTNRLFIHQDLSYVQGRAPVDVDCTLTAEDKPPALNIVENTEEEYYSNYVGNGELGDGGHCGEQSIRQMLDLMYKEEAQQYLESDPDTILQISKLNPLSVDFVPDIKSCSENVILKNNEDELVKKPKPRCRNVAVQSILNFQEIQKTETSPSENNVTNGDSVEKKHRLLQDRDSKSKSASNNKVILTLDIPSAMFKKKDTEKNNGIKEDNKTLNDVKLGSGSLTLNPTNMFRRKQQYASSTYVPSIHAEEYFKKYVKQSSVKTIIIEDVWAQAERQMRDIDEKKLTSKFVTGILNEILNEAVDEALTRASIKASNSDMADGPIES